MARSQTLLCNNAVFKSCAQALFFDTFLTFANMIFSVVYSLVINCPGLSLNNTYQNKIPSTINIPGK